MIKEEDLIEIGKFNKPHGIHGELSCSVDDDAVELDRLRCLIVYRDGLPVPFFVAAMRPRNHHTALVSLDGVESDADARQFSNEPIYALRSEVEPMMEAYADDGDDDDEGFYANDLIGLDVVADGQPLGKVTGIDDSTANLLMEVESPDRSKPLLIPVAPEFFSDIDIGAGRIELDLPDGLLDM
ncbi:MAG: 16S rRNA processing protein RimM [Muribaculaceae bacterium]|jgi:16S rRNA processing protein rimM|nr:16S rRNA processing protein RimM [Muribaculaceae bacterium]